MMLRKPGPLGHDLLAEVLVHLFHYVVVVGLFAVHLVECEYHGLFQGCGGAEDILRPYLNAIF